MTSIRRRTSDILKEARAFRATPSTTDADIYNFLLSLDTPRALSVWILYKSRNHDELVRLECHAVDYNCPFAFRDDYVATSFLSKATFLKTSFNLKDEAIKKFREYEALCHLTNRRFLNPLVDPQNNGSNVWLLNATRRKIEMILGDFCGEEFVSRANWGPGNTTLVKGEEVSGINKFRLETGITRDLYALVQPWFAVAYPAWHRDLTVSHGSDYFTMQVGNEIVTVPKNSKTDRPIAMEPGINSWFQKSIGSMIRRRLLRSGVDLQDQSVNQRLSYAGSVFRDPNRALATVDFSSASDSISTEVVRALIPSDWLLWMEATRCQLGKLGDELVRWNKFSSMGNGFTFELESLIFFAAATAVCEYLGLASDKVSVYGDDVILPSLAFQLFTDFSVFLGFRVNPKKSFSEGNFRESCGAHWFDGLDCKPIFLKERIRNVEATYKLANSIRRLSHRYGFNRSCDRRFRDCWTHLVLRLPEPLRLRVPESAGDSGIISNFDEATPSRARYGIEGYYYSALSTAGVTRETDDPAVLLARLWSMQSNEATQPREDHIRIDASFVQSTLSNTGEIKLEKLRKIEYGNTYTLRGKTKRVVSRSLVRQWYNLGPWD